MKRTLWTIATMLLLAVTVVALAHGTTGSETEMHQDGGMMNGHGKHGDDSKMMGMMSDCMSMMHGMHGMQGTGSDGSFAAAEALAQAFLNGRSDEAVEIQGISVADDGYEVSYRQGGTSGVLHVNITGGTVTPGGES